MRVAYLHGFASGPASRKARLFVHKFARNGVKVETLDLAPDFEHLTISSQLAIMEEIIHGDPVILIGSSLGGYLASLYAARHPEVERLVLMAPAFDFLNLWRSQLGVEKLEDWRKNGTVTVFHYGIGRDAQVGYELIVDAQKYQPFPDVSQPCLILHGLNDEVVPIAKSAQFAACHPNVKLISFNSGHELTDVLNDIWKAASTFLAETVTSHVPVTY